MTAATAPSSLFDLHGRVALVTGGNGGLGFGMASALAAHGCRIAIWGTNSTKNADAAAQLCRAGAEAVALRCDIADEAQVDAALEETVATLGPLDACFANAGIHDPPASFVELSMASWRRVLSVNLDGTFLTLRAVARHMVERRRPGSLVVMSSLAAIEGMAKGEHYAASKGAVISMMRALAVELARSGIRANAILPGWFDTDLPGAIAPTDQLRDRVLPRIPLRRWGTPAELGGLAVYLASDASSYHTGDTFVVDGGFGIF